MAAANRISTSLIAACLLAACASGGGLTTSEAALRSRSVAKALEVERFAEARDDLTWLAARCEAGAYRRRALLLLAATDLDPANPFFSPHEAALASAAFLRTRGIDERDVPLARALYRMAAEVGGFRGFESDEPVGAPSGLGPSACPEGEAASELRPLPAMPSVGPRTRTRTLETTAAARADSLTILRAQADSLRTELRRISELLTNGIAPTSANGGGRP